MTSGAVDLPRTELRAGDEDSHWRVTVTTDLVTPPSWSTYHRTRDGAEAWAADLDPELDAVHLYRRISRTKRKRWDLVETLRADRATPTDLSER